jgi:hypothetical protein
MNCACVHRGSCGPSCTNRTRANQTAASGSTRATLVPRPNILTSGPPARGPAASIAPLRSAGSLGLRRESASGRLQPSAQVLLDSSKLVSWSTPYVSFDGRIFGNAVAQAICEAAGERYLAWWPIPFSMPYELSGREDPSTLERPAGPFRKGYVVIATGDDSEFRLSVLHETACASGLNRSCFGGYLLLAETRGVRAVSVDTERRVYSTSYTFDFWQMRRYSLRLSRRAGMALAIDIPYVAMSSGGAAFGTTTPTLSVSNEVGIGFFDVILRVLGRDATTCTGMANVISGLIVWEHLSSAAGVIGLIEQNVADEAAEAGGAPADVVEALRDGIGIPSDYQHGAIATLELQTLLARILVLGWDWDTALDNCSDVAASLDWKPDDLPDGGVEPRRR